MFDIEFFPTPPAVIDMMTAGEDLQTKTWCEPHAGKGNIVKELLSQGAKVIACEKHADLRKIVQNYCPVLADDFFTVKSEQVSHVHGFIMNPPFSNAPEHILHAYTIAPPGCRVVALCNLNTIKNPYSKSRQELVSLIQSYGNYQDIGAAFAQAERYTDVNIALIKIQKPGVNYEDEFEGFFMEEDPEEKTGPGLMPYNVIRDLVNRYVEAIKVFDAQLETAERLHNLTNEFFHSILGSKVTSDGKPLERNEFRKSLQKAGWEFIFKRLNMEKYATKGLKEDINRFVETQEQIPFTMRNIYHMIDMVVQTNSQRMDKALVEVFDTVTMHSHDNRYNVEGWKTNSHYLLTRRFIMPTVVCMGWSGQVSNRYESERNERLEDLVKALCYVTGEDYGNHISLYHFLDYRYYLKNGHELIKDGPFTHPVMAKNKEDIERKITDYYGAEIYDRGEIAWGKWFEWGFFKVRCYKKGTMHLEFKDEDVWALFNQKIARIKGYPLPEKRSQTKYQEKQNGRKSQPTTYKKPVILSTIKIN